MSLFETLTGGSSPAELDESRRSQLAGETLTHLGGGLSMPA